MHVRFSLPVENTMRAAGVHQKGLFGHYGAEEQQKKQCFLWLVSPRHSSLVLFCLSLWHLVF